MLFRSGLRLSGAFVTCALHAPSATRAPRTMSRAFGSTALTVADLLERFGPIAHLRIRQVPPPGTATEQDVVDIHDREDRLYELVDGVLVEKAMGLSESILAVALAAFLRDFVKARRLGERAAPLTRRGR